jgi:N-carbamoyl-L-amino-acid hydrolase
LAANQARELRDREGRSLDELRAECGFEGSLESVRLRPGIYAYFVELHIEQGPILEAEGLQIGLVTGIAAPASGQILIEGEGGHAGGLLMADRRDALAAAADLILAVEKCAKNTGSEDTVATVGVCEVFPGAVNSVPSRVKLSLDVRDIDLARRDGVLRGIEAACNEVSKRRRVRVIVDVQTADAPALCSENILLAARGACDLLGLSYREMVSRAYHDSLFLSRIAPTAMIFIPCRGGVSHRPDEYSSPGQIQAGVQVLAHTIAELSSAA